MVNRMPGSNTYGGTSSAAGRSRGASSKGKDSAKSTLVPSSSGAENNNSTRSAGSGSTSSSTRKMQRNSFRRTLMFQKNKRNSNSTSSDSTETSLVERSHISVVSQTSAAGESSATNLSLNRVPSNRGALQGNIGKALSPSTVEEREAGADSPTFPLPPKPAKQTVNERSSSMSSSLSLPKKKVAGIGGQEIPQSHVENILRFYGGNNMSPASLDLYRDVLKVSPDASDREIRIAYFRRGREILGDHGGSPHQTQDVAKAKENKFDEATKSRFQAVSMAYEILSTPSWKETYLKQGLKRKGSRSSIKTNTKFLASANPPSETSTIDAFSSPSSTVAKAFPNEASSDNGKLQKGETAKLPIPSMPKLNVAERRRKQRQIRMQVKPQKLPTVLRKSSFTNGEKRSPSKRSSFSVRWKDHVEELVFANHPNEHASDTESDYSDYDPDEEEDIFKDEGINNQEKPRRNTFQNSLTSNGERQAAPFSGQGKSMNTGDSASAKNGGRNRRRRKNKPRIVIDSEELESHLQLMDSEAEKHFVQDFWDNFEESMDGILSLVDSIGGGDAPSSWLSPAPPTEPSFASKRQSASRGMQNAQDTTIGRSSSYDSTMPKRNKVVVDCDNEELMKRSSSFPISRSSPSTLDAVSPSPQPAKCNQIGLPVVSPDEKGLATESSPFDIISSSWPHNIETQEKTNGPREQKQKLSPIRMVSPSSNSRSSKISMNGKDGVSVDQETTTSGSQPQQQFFRPISPCGTEASELVSSDFVPDYSVPSSNLKDGTKNVGTSAESDEFDMNSRLSGLESVDLAELENPFRSKASSSTGFSEDSQPKTSTTVGISVVPMDSNDSSSKVQKKEIRSKQQCSTEKEAASCSSTSVFDQSVEDVFAGVEEDSPVERCDMPDCHNIKMQDISIQRSSSQMSELSESVISSRKENSEASATNVPGSKVSGENPVTKPMTVTLETSSILSASTKKSLAARSQGSATYSSYASSARGDTNSVHSSDSKELDDAGFFEYFMAYVGAVMTECANVGTNVGVAEYHQDFLSLFSNDTAEVREPPTATRRSSENSKSTTANC